MEIVREKDFRVKVNTYGLDESEPNLNKTDGIARNKSPRASAGRNILKSPRHSGQSVIFSIFEKNLQKN